MVSLEVTDNVANGEIGFDQANLVRVVSEPEGGTPTLVCIKGRIYVFVALLF